MGAGGGDTGPQRGWREWNKPVITIIAYSFMASGVSQFPMTLAAVDNKLLLTGALPYLSRTWRGIGGDDLRLVAAQISMAIHGQDLGGEEELDTILGMVDSLYSTFDGPEDENKQEEEGSVQ